MKLDPAEADLLSSDAAGFSEALSDPIAQARYRRLSAAAAGGEVPDELLPALEAMLELVFDKGRPSNRAVLQGLYGKTPRGRRQTAAAREVNRALRAVRGQLVQDIRVSTGPSRHTLAIETDRCKLTLELDSSGAHVVSLEAGG